MHAFFALAALAGAAAAGSLVIQDTGDNTILGLASQVPVCANICLFQAAVAVGCEDDDYACQCAKKDQLATLTQNCLAKSCNADQAETANDLTKKICKAVKRGLPVVRRSQAPPVPRAPEPAPEPFPAPAPAFPDAPLLAPRSGSFASFATSATASSIPPATTTASAPTSVSTAGAAAGCQVTAAAMAGAVAVAGVFLF